MKQIDVVIPTRNRTRKLQQTLDSIPSCSNIRVIVVCDGDSHTYSWLKHNRGDVEARFVAEWRGAVYCRNSVICEVRDGLLYATDDIVFLENSIHNAFECFNKNFRDEDGVVGFVQEGNNFHPTGVALVGQKFLQRYPSKQLFCPLYFHFACQEVYDLCCKLGNKFVQAKEAKVFHYHPCNFPEEMDQTHNDARKFKVKDHELMNYRRENGLIWGLQ